MIILSIQCHVVIFKYKINLGRFIILSDIKHLNIVELFYSNYFMFYKKMSQKNLLRTHFCPEGIVGY